MMFFLTLIERDVKKRRDELSMRVQGAQQTFDAVQNQMNQTNQEISAMTSQLTLSQGELEKVKVQRAMAQSRVNEVQSLRIYENFFQLLKNRKLYL